MKQNNFREKGNLIGKTHCYHYYDNDDGDDDEDDDDYFYNYNPNPGVKRRIFVVNLKTLGINLQKIF